MAYLIPSIQKLFMENFLKGDKDIYQYIVGDDDSFKEERLRIYSKGARLNLLENLRNDFPTLMQLMGKPLFDSIMNQYLDRYPSHSFSVYHIGNHLIEFLVEHPETKSQLLWQEMALFEQTLDKVSLTQDGPHLARTELQQVPQEQWPYIKFAFHPSMTQLKFSYNVPDYWNALNDNAPIQLSLYDHPKTWLLWRYNNGVYFKTYNETQIKMIKNITEGKMFGEVCEDLVSLMPQDEISTFAIHTLVDWLDENILSSFEIDQTFMHQNL